MLEGRGGHGECERQSPGVLPKDSTTANQPFTLYREHYRQESEAFRLMAAARRPGKPPCGRSGVTREVHVPSKSLSF